MRSCQLIVISTTDKKPCRRPDVEAGLGPKKLRKGLETSGYLAVGETGDAGNGLVDGGDHVQGEAAPEGQVQGLYIHACGSHKGHQQILACRVIRVDGHSSILYLQDLYN